MLRHELVDDEGWISSDRFNRTLAVYQVLPGPEAQELTIYFGMLAGGRLGGFLAGLCFLLPGFILMVVLSWFYVSIGISSPVFAAAFAGCQAAVLALIVRAAHRIASRAVVNRYLLFIAASAVVAGLAGVPFPIPLAAGGLSYVAVVRGWRFVGSLIAASVIAISLTSLLAPDRAAPPPATDDAGGTVTTAELLFTGLRGGALTFGGAYTAIPFVEQDATGDHGWMTRSQFLDGIALSGVIPAPLVIFATFVGYLGGGLIGAIAVTIGMFLPAFVITLVGHSYLEAAVAHRGLHAILDGITAAVVGLVGATAITFAPSAVGNLAAAGIFIIALMILYLWRSSAAVAVVVVSAGIAGILLTRL